MDFDLMMYCGDYHHQIHLLHIIKTEAGRPEGDIKAKATVTFMVVFKVEAKVPKKEEISTNFLYWPFFYW